MGKHPLSSEELLKIASRVLDPEVPVLNVVEMGIVRRVTERAPGHIVVTITPTYSGCPAMRVIEDDLRSAFADEGFSMEVETVFSPPWTTDWMNEEAREKLRKYGIAPPGQREEALVTLGKKRRPVACPFCRSEKTELRSEFGATACKSFHYCRECLQPFEHFKAI